MVICHCIYLPLLFFSSDSCETGSVVLLVAWQQEKFRKLLDINESLGDTIDLISPTRELVKEGKILRIAARDGDRYERYMFLVNSVVFVILFTCQELCGVLFILSGFLCSCFVALPSQVK